MPNTDIKPAFEKDNIAIAFAVDQNYLPYLKNAIKSLVANCKCGNLDILVLHDGELDCNGLLNYFSGAKGISIRLVDIGGEAMELTADFVDKSYLTVACTYRLLLPELLPAYDKIVWLDTDIVVTGDISELFNQPLDGHWLGAVVDIAIEKGPLMDLRTETSLRWARKYGFEPWTGYFNSGVLVMNLAALRTANVQKRLFEIATDPDSLFADQDALNVVCRGHVRYLDRRWNFQVLENSGWVMDGGGIIHFIGEPKPWQRPSKEHADLWFRYVDSADMLPLLKDAIKWHDKWHDKRVADIKRHYNGKLREMKHSISYKLGRALTKPFRLVSGIRQD